MYTLLIIKYSFFHNSFTKILDIHNMSSQDIEEIATEHGFVGDLALNYPNDKDDLVVNTVGSRNEMIIFAIKYKGE